MVFARHLRLGQRIKGNGFTLIELLVVIAIIGILAGIVLVSLSSARVAAQDARRISDIKQIQNALELYRAQNGQYPVGGWWSSNAASWATLETALAPFIDLPSDPVNEVGSHAYAGVQTYSYYANAYGGAGRWYMLVSTLENPNVSLDASDGVRACDGTTFDYGGNDGYILTKGGSC